MAKLEMSVSDSPGTPAALRSKELSKHGLTRGRLIKVKLASSSVM